MKYFITEKQLKDTTALQSNVDVTDLVPFIQTASDMVIQPILGSYFYTYLLDKYNDDTPSVDEAILIGYITPCVAWKTCSDALIGLSRQIKNKGLQAQNGDFSSQADLREIAFYSDHYEQKCTFYVNRLVKYLKTNKKLFAQFISDDNKDSNIGPENPENSFNDSILFV